LSLRFLSVVRAVMTPGFQWPCSSIAALPLASRPAELPAPCWAGVARKPFWNGWASISFCVFCPALTKHGSSILSSERLDFSVSSEHSRIAK
jgi:hypothetical protein